MTAARWRALPTRASSMASHGDLDAVPGHGPRLRAVPRILEWVIDRARKAIAGNRLRIARHALSERDLKDIGLSRADVDRAGNGVWRDFRRPPVHFL